MVPLASCRWTRIREGHKLSIWIQALYWPQRHCDSCKPGGKDGRIKAWDDPRHVDSWGYLDFGSQRFRLHFNPLHLSCRWVEISVLRLDSFSCYEGIDKIVDSANCTDGMILDQMADRNSKHSPTAQSIQFGQKRTKHLKFAITFAKALTSIMCAS